MTPPDPSRVSEGVDGPDPRAPRYTPDGRWFWTGTAWIPGTQVVGGQAPSAPPPPPAAAPRPPRRRVRAWQVATAAALLVVLLAGGATGFALLHRNTAYQGPRPSAYTILQSPFARHVGSATFTAVGTSPANGDERAKGEIFFAPQHAFEMTETLDGYWAQQYLDFGGYGYARNSADGRWVLDGSYSSQFFYLGWDGTPISGRISVTGPVELDGEQVWHLNDHLGDQWWIGVDDGRPVQAIDMEMRYTFGNWGHAPKLHAPAASDLITPVYRGTVGKAVVTPLVSVTVDAVSRSQQARGMYAPAGYTYLSVQISVSNPTTYPLGDDLMSPPVMGATKGGEYWQDLLAEPANTPGGDQAMAPGASESATLVYDLSTSEKRVLLEYPTTQLYPDRASPEYLIVIPVTL